MVTTMATSGIWEISAHIGLQTVVPLGNKGADPHYNPLPLQEVPKPNTWTTLKVKASGVHGNKAFQTDLTPMAFKDGQQMPPLCVLTAPSLSA